VPSEAYDPAIDPAVTAHPFLLYMAQVAQRRRNLIWAAAAAFAVLALAAALLAPPLYTSSVLIMPPQQSGSTSAAMMAQMGSLGALASAGGGLSIKNPNDLQVSLLKSETVEDAMVARFHLQQLYRRRYVSSARKRWERHTRIDSGIKDGLIKISVADKDPHRAAELANGWLEEYRRLTANLAVTEASQRRLFFEQELNGARDDLARAEESLKETQQRTGVIDIDGQARAMIASAAVLRAQVASKQVEIQAMREFATGQNPDLVRAQQELSAMEGQLSAMDASSDRGDGDLAMPKGPITEAGLEYARALRELKFREVMYDLLTRQYEAARVDEARQGPLVQVVDPAQVPDRPSSLYRMLIAIAAVLFALPMGLLAACAVEVTADALAARRKAGSWTNALIEAWGESAGSTTADAGRGKPVAAEAAAYEADAALLNRIA